MLRGQLDVLGAGRGSVVLVAGPLARARPCCWPRPRTWPRIGGRVFCGGGEFRGAGGTLGVILDALVSAEDRLSIPGGSTISVSLLTSGPGCCASCWKPSRKPHTAPRCWS